MYSEVDEVVHPENNLRQNNHPPLPIHIPAPFYRVTSFLFIRPLDVPPSTPFQVVTDQPFFQTASFHAATTPFIAPMELPLPCRSTSDPWLVSRLPCSKTFSDALISPRLITVSFRETSPQFVYHFRPLGRTSCAVNSNSAPSSRIVLKMKITVSCFGRTRRTENLC